MGTTFVRELVLLTVFNLIHNKRFVIKILFSSVRSIFAYITKNVSVDIFPLADGKEWRTCPCFIYIYLNTDSIFVYLFFFSIRLSFSSQITETMFSTPFEHNEVRKKTQNQSYRSFCLI